MKKAKCFYLHPYSVMMHIELALFHHTESIQNLLSRRYSPFEYQLLAILRRANSRYPTYKYHNHNISEIFVFSFENLIEVLETDSFVPFSSRRIKDKFSSYGNIITCIQQKEFGFLLVNTSTINIT